ncbi:MAG: glycosyltransferase family 39 protein [Muribaculaceae bacterium]|nr:glycosyltransferase family 39 protein [Muribaculaceae bacterium]
MEAPKRRITDRHTKQTVCVWGFFLLFSMLAAAIGSPDSPFTHNGLYHCDTSWFMDGGRWLMQGYTPYVDFADSKGPLLWLFYGLGYLLDKDGWSGMFVLYALYYAWVYVYIYKAAKEMLGSGRWAVCAAMFMPYFYMCLAHYENRTEDLFQLPLAYMIYLAVKALKGRQISGTAFFVSGLWIGAMLFVKWSFPAMLIPPAFVILIYGSRRGDDVKPHSFLRRILKNAGIGLSGVFAVVAVAAVWMSAAGAFGAMIQEYFLNTALTVSNSGGTSAGEIIRNLGLIFQKKSLIALCICTPIVGLRLFGPKGLWLTAAAVWIIFISSIHYIDYYSHAAASFGIFVPIAGCLLLMKRIRLKLWAMGVEPVAVCIMLFYYSAKHDNFGSNGHSDGYDAMCDRVASLERPRILYRAFNCGLGIKSGATPPCRYWSIQFGATQEMEEEMQAAMKEHTADIVVTEADNFEPEIYGYTTDESDVFPHSYPDFGNLRIHWSPKVENVP